MPGDSLETTPTPHGHSVLRHLRQIQQRRNAVSALLRPRCVSAPGNATFGRERTSGPGAAVQREGSADIARRAAMPCSPATRRRELGSRGTCAPAAGTRTGQRGSARRRELSPTSTGSANAHQRRSTDIAPRQRLDSSRTHELVSIPLAFVRERCIAVRWLTRHHDSKSLATQVGSPRKDSGRTLTTPHGQRGIRD
jgi:hypothetical protein